MLPEHLSPLPPPEILPGLRTAGLPDINHASLSHNKLSVPIRKPPSLYSLFCKMLKTGMNRFGLFHIYDTDTPPHHDPEDPYSIENMSLSCADLESSNVGPSNKPSYYPYPNKSSMSLGDWYWNQGTQKSKDSFRQLLDIVGNPSFLPSSVSQTAWEAIDHQLGQNQFDGYLLEWLCEDDGWKCSLVTVSVPFHTQSRNPGPKDYTVPGFYHWSLISIIKEKITNLADASLFHFDPYELRWQPPHRDHAVKVHGELFTSTVFIKVN